jgi:ABC-type branched-subunit amino acid transport system ATPase component
METAIRESTTLKAAVQVLGVSKRYGGVQALDDVSLRVEPGQIFSLLGPNGSGKTTLFNVISGFTRATAGQVSVFGERIDRLAPHRIVSAGLARTFQQTMVFGSMTVQENMVVAAGHSRWNSDEALSSIISGCGLGSLRPQVASSLPYGTQKRLGVAMAVATGARVVLLDEPGAGLSIKDLDDLASLIRFLRSDGLTVMIVDHDMGFVLPLSDRVAVLDVGKVIFDGRPEDVVNDERVISVYLGT